METTRTDGFEIQLRQIDRAGSTWIVRLYKRTLFLRKSVSSDWFLDGTQAREYAEQLRRELTETKSISWVVRRSPGWRLHPEQKK
jgi:hypothetical protein